MPEKSRKFQSRTLAESPPHRHSQPGKESVCVPKKPKAKKQTITKITPPKKKTVKEKIMKGEYNLIFYVKHTKVPVVAIFKLWVRKVFSKPAGALPSFL